MRIFRFFSSLVFVVSIIYILEINNLSKNMMIDNIVNSKIKKQKDYSVFMKLYRKSKQRLFNQVLLVNNCMIQNSNKKCNYKAEDYITMLPNEMTKPTEIYHIYNGGYSSLIEPKCDYEKTEIIVGIPCGPPQLIGRIAVRETYMKESIIDGYNVKYMFITGLAPEPYYSYPLDYLIEESNIFNDILVFNFINTYHNITLLMMSMYKWLIEKHPNIKYFIRSNLDVLFFPGRINGLLRESKFDLISEISRFKRTKVYYPQGAFYIFSMKMVSFIYNQSFIHKPIHRWDDVYYGEILSEYNNNTFRIYDLGGEKKLMKWDCNFCKDSFDKNIIALHPFFPAAIFLFYDNLDK